MFISRSNCWLNSDYSTISVDWNNVLLRLCGSRKNIKASAICRYTFSQVQHVFDGPFMEVQDSKWREFTGRVPEPRPGSVRPLESVQVLDQDPDSPLNSPVSCSASRTGTVPRVSTPPETCLTTSSPSPAGTR